MAWFITYELVQLGGQSLIDAPLLLGLTIYANDFQNFVPFFICNVIDVDMFSRFLNIFGDNNFLLGKKNLTRWQIFLWVFMGGWGLQNIKSTRFLHLVHSGFLHCQDIYLLFTHDLESFNSRALPIAINVPSSDLQLFLGLILLEPLGPHCFPFPFVLRDELFWFGWQFFWFLH